MENKKKDKILDEIKSLKKVKQDWSKTRKDRWQASNLLNKVSIFNHTFTVSYEFAQKYYVKNELAEIEITDGVEDIEYYAKSKLKRKDDHYFYSGLNKLKRGIDELIRNLNNQLEN